MRRGPFTLIVLPAPGAPARQLEIPGHWRLMLATLCLLSLGASLFVGRKARAWFDLETIQGALLSSDLEAMGEGGGHVRFSTAPRELSPLSQPSSALALGWTAADRASVEGLALTPLTLFDVNTHQRIALSPFAEQGQLNLGAFDALSHFLRCRRTGEAMPMSPHLIGLLSRISRHFSSAPLHVVSAHRAVDGITTRSTSQHARGTAADIRIPGVSIQTLANAASELGAAGIGLYTKNRFVHVDVRAQPYSWSDAVKRKDTDVDDELARDAELDAEATSAPVMPVDTALLGEEPAAL